MSKTMYTGQRTLLLLRGYPGAGKTTLGNLIINKINRNGYSDAKVISNDDWRGNGDNRVYRDEWNHIAKSWCIGRVADCFVQGATFIVVPNTFATIDQMRPYADLRDNLRAMGMDISMAIAEVQGPAGRSVHGTGVDYQHYIDEWEVYSGEFGN